MYTPIVPARLAFAADGTPFSETYGDVYHSADGGLGQARHVFLAGNGLPERWRGREHFVVLETGFGLGLNFLATWAAWREDPARPARLHFVSVEKHPFSAADLATAHTRWPQFAPLAEDLRQHWPLPTAGLHRLHLDSGRVTLTLWFGEAAEGLEQIVARADAIYLDGFSPARNPDLWAPRIFHLLSRLAAAEATLATWSVAGEVREGLRRAGFEVAKAPGFGGKREMLTGRAMRPRDTTSPGAARRGLVIGAGIAGTSVAQRLAERGWEIELIDEAAGPGQGASGNLAGVLRPLPSLDDNRLARLTRAGTLYARHHLARLAAQGHPARWAPCGVLHLARDPVHEGKQRQVVERQQLPEGYLRFVDREEAARRAGWPVELGGWWFPIGGWVQPPSLCRANVDAAGERVRAHFGTTLARLEHGEAGWSAYDTEGREIAAAPVAILANGVGIGRFPQAAALPVRSARGQVSHLAAAAGSAPDVVVCRLGYVSPAVDGVRCAGATFAVDDDDTTLREVDHADNLAKLDYILPGYAERNAPLAGRVGFRPASPDRLPMIGAVPLASRLEAAVPLHRIPRHSGLYAVSGFGARGLVWSALAGELLASMLTGEPLPIERDLADAVDPARYLLRPARTLSGEE